MPVKEKNVKTGSSTVFLALVFTVVITLFTAVCALLCYRSEKANIRRSLDIALESEFGKFYRPLFDDYRLLYYMDNDEDMFDAGVLSYFVMNQDEMPRLLKLKPSEFYSEKKYYAVDDKCGNVLKQMTEGIAYTLGEDAVDGIRGKIKDKFGTYGESDEVLDKFSDESRDISEDARAEERVIRLLEIVEGVYIDKGKVKCRKPYVKQGVKGKITAASSGIDSPAVWEAVKARKWNMKGELKKLAEDEVPASGARFKEYIKKLKGLLEVTKKAYDLAAGIDNDISGKSRNGLICDISGMKEKLYDNVNILKSIIGSGLGPKDCAGMLKGYHVKDLYFDYSTLSLEKKENPVKNLDSNVSDIVSFLLGDDMDISSSYIEETGIYEKVSDKVSKKDDRAYDFKKPEELPDFLESCKSEAKASGMEETLRLGLYVNEYFNDFCGGGDKGSGSHALSYEKEYIICGKKSDRKNLEGIVNRLLLMRTGLSFAYLASDREKSNLAYMTAAAVVGFTGMEALIRCTSYVILAGWAYEDACVDVSLLLKGKKVPFLKKKGNLNIEYGELLSFGKELIREKTKRSGRGSGAGYSDYLMLFLNMKGRNACLYGSMDIIHCNMKLAHSNLFSFQNAMYGAKVHVACSQPYYGEAEARYSY